MNIDFERITVGGDWAYIDYIGGRPLEPGDYDIRWPDQSITRERVMVSMGSTDIGDHGSIYKGADNRAYIVVDVHGLPVDVYLRGRRDVLLRKVST